MATSEDRLSEILTAIVPAFSAKDQPRESQIKEAVDRLLETHPTEQELDDAIAHIFDPAVKSAVLGADQNRLVREYVLRDRAAWGEAMSTTKERLS